MAELEKSSYPDDELKQLLKSFWEFAQQQARDLLKLEPDYVIIRVESRNLEWPINRSFDLNKVENMHNKFIDEFLNYFRQIDQSTQNKGKTSVFEEFFTIDVNAITLKNNKAKFSGGRGQKNRRAMSRQIDNIYPGAIMNVPDVKDDYCLFRSVLLLVKKDLMTSNEFCKYKWDAANKQKKDIKAMMNWCKIEQNDGYSIREHGQKIQVIMRFNQFHNFLRIGFLLNGLVLTVSMLLHLNLGHKITSQFSKEKLKDGRSKLLFIFWKMNPIMYQY